MANSLSAGVYLYVYTEHSESEYRAFYIGRKNLDIEFFPPPDFHYFLYYPLEPACL